MIKLAQNLLQLDVRTGQNWLELVQNWSQVLLTPPNFLYIFSTPTGSGWGGWYAFSETTRKINLSSILK